MVNSEKRNLDIIQNWHGCRLDSIDSIVYCVCVAAICNKQISFIQQKATRVMLDYFDNRGLSDMNEIIGFDNVLF